MRLEEIGGKLYAVMTWEEWLRTPREYRGKSEGGEKMVLALVPNKGTCLVAVKIEG